MALEICTRQALPFSIDLPVMNELAVRAVAEAELTELQRQPVRVGNQQLEFGQLFECRVVGDDPGLVWNGDTGRLNFIAHRLMGGYVRVEGDVGDRAASEMHGGRLQIAGNAGHWLASDLRGGTITVAGSCGQWAAASLPARRRGMTGGVVVVRGSAAGGLGRRMRRGILVVEGDSHEPAAEMLAGTVILGGRVSGGIGTLMKRGTIVCLEALGEEQRASLSRGLVQQPLVWRLIQRHLMEQQASLRQDFNGPFQLYHAARWTGSRGEIWEANGRP